MRPSLLPGTHMTVIPTIDIVDALAAEYATKSPREILELALSQHERYGNVHPVSL